ncbi:hypothetical protein FNW52_12485 [Flavobacterium sp. ZT3R18]|uniref:DUF6712 family protein n=1 Tax=Flavobacterium sp. ZT3R18 TaxID=2594429 RepID=UPI00117B0245|nr:hypothetical protein [Flavobacterium sp. ZT3R18]TRX34952.1 hypothetical protein FNW52_12485 [Flavobacterium sp. ZT3R18]
MNNILTPTQLQAYKDIGNKIDEKKINPIIEQAQITELKVNLGDRFYFDLLNNLTNPTYQPLLDGCDFNYFGVNYHQDGIKALLSDYFMSKYVLQINTNFTPFGATTKTPQDGEIADRNSLKDISTQQLQLAGARWEIIKMYLNVSTSTFPNWHNNVYGSDSTDVERTFRFRKI